MKSELSSKIRQSKNKESIVEGKLATLGFWDSTRFQNSIPVSKKEHFGNALIQFALLSLKIMYETAGEKNFL